MSTTIKIIETGAIETLTLIDRRSGCDCFSDFASVGDWELEVDEDGDETGRYLLSQHDYNWWAKVTDATQDMNDRIDDLKEEYPDSYDEIDQLVAEAADGHELEDVPGVVTEALDEWEANASDSDDDEDE
jgi:hypothetical protein